MADRVLPGPVDSSACIREAVCVHTKKIYDSCRDKDCIEDLRVYPTVGSQTYIDNAFSVRPKSAELLYAEVNVEAITFNKGYYTVDVTYFYKITGETFPGGNTVTGLAIFDKRVMLCGGEGTVKTFSSDLCDCSCVDDGMPTAYVEAVDPIALHLKLVDANCNVCCDNDRHDIPACILARFGEALVTTDTGRSCTSPSASSPSSALSATPSCSSRPTITACPRRNAPAAAATTTPARSSPRFASPSRSSSPPATAPRPPADKMDVSQKREFLRHIHPFILSYASSRPMRTPMAEAIMRPRVQPEESPRAWRPGTLVLKLVSILTLLE